MLSSIKAYKAFEVSYPLGKSLPLLPDEYLYSTAIPVLVKRAVQDKLLSKNMHALDVASLLLTPRVGATDTTNTELLLSMTSTANIQLPFSSKFWTATNAAFQRKGVSRIGIPSALLLRQTMLHTCGTCPNQWLLLVAASPSVGSTGMVPILNSITFPACNATANTDYFDGLWWPSDS